MWTRYDSQDNWQEVDISRSNSNTNLTVEGATLQWRPNEHYGRVLPHLSTHFVNSSLTLTTDRYELELFSVEFLPPYAVVTHDEKNKGITFVDLALNRKYNNECFEGAWGRTSCYHSSDEEFDADLYNLHGGLFGTDFPFNMYFLQ